MASSGARYHIPFPRAFLSLNAPFNKATPPVEVVNTPDAVSHSFLSNRHVARTSSISSVSSDESAISAPSSESKAPESPVQAKRPDFLTLNSSYKAPPAASKKMTEAEKSAFLSNKH